MPRTQDIPITGDVLRWAIDESGWQRSDLAEKLNVSPDSLSDWETGSAQPSKTQFNELVRHLKRPSAVFFLPSPPPPDDIPSAFRTIRGGKPSLGPEERRRLRDARRIQSEVSAIRQDLNFPEVELFPASIANDPEEVARAERERFGISVDTQLGWKSESEAFNAWRSSLENIGVLVFVQQIGHGNMRGYAVRDEYAPLTGINSTGFNVSSRIYSLFHEYAHLLLSQDDVTHQHTFQRDPRQQDDVECWCETFAASFLIPREELERFVLNEYGWRSGQRVGLETVKDQLGRLSRKFKVSLRAMAIRLQDIGVAPSSLFDSLGPQPSRGGGGKGLPRTDQVKRRYGSRVMALFSDALQRDLIDVDDILDLLGITLDDWSQLSMEQATG